MNRSSVNGAVLSDCLKLLQALRGFPPQHKLGVRIIDGRKEMVQQIRPDDAVEQLRAKGLRELAQATHDNGQVLDGSVADSG